MLSSPTLTAVAAELPRYSDRKAGCNKLGSTLATKLIYKMQSAETIIKLVLAHAILQANGLQTISWPGSKQQSGAIKGFRYHCECKDLGSAFILHRQEDGFFNHLLQSAAGKITNSSMACTCPWVTQNTAKNQQSSAAGKITILPHQ